MSGPQAKTLSYRPEIDGLRALAIVLVVLGHAGVIFRGGFLGVDVFFIISGYLITSLVSRQITQGNFSLARFWMRRVHRLLPALLVVSLATLAAGSFLLLPNDLAELGRSVSAQAALLANVFFWQTSDYFGGPAAQKPLIHYWSLAVEEQFYLFFPLLLLLRPKKSLWVLAASSFALTLYAVPTHPSACFYLLPTRAWELLLGGCLALSRWEVPERKRSVASWLGLLGIVAGALLIHEHKVYWPGWTTLIPCLATCLLIASCRQLDTPVARFLSHPKVVHLGLISYSWYLWHWPLIAFWNYWKVGRTPLWVRIVLILLGGFLGHLSYRYVETPFRKPRANWSPKKVLLTALLIQLSFVGLGWALHHSEGWPTRLPAKVQRLAQRGDPPWGDYQLSLKQAQEGQFLTLGREGPYRLCLWGDSHAMALIPALEKLALENGCRVMVATQSGVVPLLGYPTPDVCPLGPEMESWNRAVLEHWSQTPELPPLLVVCRWSYQPQANLQECLQNTVRAIEESGGQCFLLKEVPVYPYDPRKASLRNALFRLSQDIGMTPSEFENQNLAIQAASAAVNSEALKVLDPSTAFFPTGERAIVELEGESCYWDDNHLTAVGAKLLEPLLTVLFEEPKREL